MLIYATLMVCAWLIGSLASAIIVCRIAGKPDPRKEGSGNPGATNVRRLHGSRMAALVLVGDVAKGMVPVAIALFLGFPEEMAALVGFAAFIGHLYPVFFRFSGGKGVATFSGVILVINGWAGLAAFAAWLLLLWISRYVCLASISAAMLVPVFAAYTGSNAVSVAIYALMGVLIVWSHRSNIRKLLNGTENKLGSKPSSR
ncbi:MAG: glycerol-3-phosphate 1-O-acyltransferase PlsY [Candidatus Eutrophobiaceae bacterium]